MRVPPDQSATLAEHRGERLVGVLGLERTGDVGEAGAEQERVDALSRIGHRMEEMQEQPRVFAHRARNVEQRHDRRQPGLRAAVFEVDQRAARLHAGAQGAAHVDERGRGGRRASRRVRTASRASTMRESPPWRCAISAADIWAKSLPCSTSRSETVRRKSISISRCSPAACPRGRRTAPPACARSPAAAFAVRAGPAAASSPSAGRDSRACGRRS